MQNHEFNPNDRQWNFFVGKIGNHARMVIWAETKKEAIKRIKAITGWRLLDGDNIPFHMIDAETVNNRPVMGTAVILSPKFPNHFTPREEPIPALFSPEEQKAFDDWARDTYFDDGISDGELQANL